MGLDKKVRFFSVESDYYNWTLEERMLRLKSPSIHHLCKSLIFINNKHKLTNDNELDPTNSKYYCVITQYSEKLSTQKLLNGIRSLRNPQLPKTKFNPRIAPEDKSFELTGFINNAVSPIGMKEAALPIIISEAITKLDPPLFYLG